MKNKIVKDEGYHPANIPTADVCQKQDEPPANNYRTVHRSREPLLYDHNDKPLIRKIGFKLFLWPLRTSCRKPYRDGHATRSQISCKNSNPVL